MIRILLSARLGERRLTQADLARMTGIRAATINEYYNELTSKISLDHFDLICRDWKPTSVCHRGPDRNEPHSPARMLYASGLFCLSAVSSLDK